MSAVPRSGLILIIVVIISLIAEGDAQNSSQVASSAVPQTSAQTIAQSSESPIIYPDDSCNPEHKDLIYQAFGDAMQMTKLTTQSTIDYIDDPAFWHIFGQRAVDNTTAIKNAFEQVNDGQWSISATCNFGNSTRCDDFAMYGGIAEEKGDAQRRSNESQLYSPHLMFCRDFFALPPLDHRVQMGINHPTDFKARYTLGYFHDNQATTLLRTLFHYLPQSDDLHRPISDLWIFVRQNLPSGVTDKWSACYGIACAKVLARVDDNANDWASVNADGYALFALSKYVAPYINNNFPFFPRITDGTYFPDLAFANNEGDDAPIQVNTAFQIPLLFQPNYQASRLQPTRNVFDADTSLDPDRKADITRVPYVRNVPENSASTKEEVWAHAFSEATNDQLLNIDTTYNRTCFGQNSNLHPYAKDFNGNEAVDLATTFCEDIIKDWDYATPIPPTVRDTSHFRNASREYPLTQVSAQAHLGFFAVADPATFIQPRSAKQFFEGGTDEAKVEHCKLTYKDIIKGCDTDVQKRRGGVLKLNDRLYGVYTTPDDRPDHLPWLTDYTSLGDLTCADYNATSYWRIATSVEEEQTRTYEVQSAPIAITDTDKLSKLCTCWYPAYPFTADLFCKGAAVKCENLATEDGRKAAIWSKFAC